jgi:hypothetical protein
MRDRMRLFARAHHLSLGKQILVVAETQGEPDPAIGDALTPLDLEARDFDAALRR